MLEVFFKMIIGHAIADFSLQNDAMAIGKVRPKMKLDLSESQVSTLSWQYWLSAHALIHGGAVWIATGVVWLGMAETLAHGVIDFLKCEGITNQHQDQALHLICKFVWLGMLWCCF